MTDQVTPPADISWTVGPRTHTLRLWVTRYKPEPPLYMLEHTVMDITQSSNHREIFEDLAQAQAKWAQIRRRPPGNYKNAQSL